ncbi:MAG: hypothetical protein M3N97_09715 [Pseudomonadota bacterium]|nr:hypothetical protein [Pseudomonadota bacterium]
MTASAEVFAGQPAVKTLSSMVSEFLAVEYRAVMSCSAGIVEAKSTDSKASAPGHRPLCENAGPWGLFSVRKPEFKLAGHRT